MNESMIEALLQQDLRKANEAYQEAVRAAYRKREKRLSDIKLPQKPSDFAEMYSRAR